MTAAQTEAWLDIIPAIPLARGVPIVVVAENIWHGRIGVVVAAGPILVSVRITRAPDEPTFRLRNDLRADLADSLGFGYALRSLRLKNEGELPPHGHPLLKDGDGNYQGTDWDLLVERFWRNETTDGDRLALAKALAEVQR